jgi:acetolactate synthase-1/2/3 large subunit
MSKQAQARSVADLLVERLVTAGVQHVFGVGGANIEDMFAAVQRRRPSIRAVLTKHEHGGASAAAAYSRVSGGLGVVLATSGGGAMNLVHGLTEARASHVTLLAIIGEPPSELQGAGAFQDTSGRGGAVDAEAVFAAAAGFCRRIESAGDASRLLDEALAHIAASSGPAVLLIAKDRQTALSAGGSERESLLPVPQVPQLAVGQAEDAARRLAAGACVIIAGEEVLRARAQKELARLVSQLDARVAVAPDARDAFDNRDPRFLGVAGAMGHEAVAVALRKAKTCLLVGTRLPLLTRMGLEPLLLELPLVSLGREAPFFTGDHHQHLVTELRSGLRALCAALEGSGASRAPLPSPAVVAAPAVEFDSASVLRLVEQSIAGDSVVLVDAGNTGASAVHHLRAPRSGRWLVAMGMAGMGYAFGAAIGAACAAQRRCWVIAGDGAFYMHGLEIHTAIEHSLPITYVIFDNRAHGMCLVREQLLMREVSEYNAFRPAHLASGLAAMFPGLYARECATLAELEDALHTAPTIAGPSVISVVLPEVEVPPFVAFQRADPAAKIVSRGGCHAGE